ncbi:PH domain-containing protein [Bacillus wudalianchiensis]|uniref:YdbS-like PH domain-containing protein n=1 Tax=Pseudobacillus wudalianchiensis TaxID=1743143 RepID=A0A1B9AAS9_9BACI|nr:PH domain-containing protein [Bacillus wudalianchiensis]OCA80949.1 hypothetical protein A8F95_17770 [Bacillus wudalianchiensis]
MKEPAKRISTKALRVWRISGVISSVFLWLLLIGASVAIFMNQWPLWIFFILVAVGVAEVLIVVVILPNMRWKRWRYEVREREIELQRGVFIVRRTLIPMTRVQHVDTKQGPLLRKYGLGAIHISTAATIHEIPAVEIEEAEEMRKVIAALARVEEDV